MQRTEQTSLPTRDAERLARRAESLGLKIDAEQLSALAKQLGAIQTLEEAELSETQPILTLDADWHD